MRHLAVIGFTAAWLLLAVSAQDEPVVSAAEPQAAAAGDTAPPPAPPKADPAPPAPPAPKPPAPVPTPPPPVATPEEIRRLSAAESLAEAGLELYLASGRADMDAVKKHLLAGASVNYEHQSGWTPLGNCAMNHAPGYEAVVTHLLQAKADPDVKDPRGRTPLFLAVSDGANEAVIREIVKFSKNLNPHDMHGVTALNVATRKGNVMAAKVLLAAGADPKKGDSFGGSAYDEAVNSASSEMRSLFNLTAADPAPTKAAGEL